MQEENEGKKRHMNKTQKKKKEKTNGIIWSKDSRKNIFERIGGMYKKNDGINNE